MIKHHHKTIVENVGETISKAGHKHCDICDAMKKSYQHIKKK